jgi:hypothetical protein
MCSERRGLIAVIAAFMLLVGNSSVAQMAPVEAAARGFPVLMDAEGKVLAQGEFVQWLEGTQLHVRITYQFKDNHRIVENAVFQQRPKLVQTFWSFREEKDSHLLREFRVDFASGNATAKKLENGELKQWTEKVDIASDQVFAGFGFTLALKSFRERLLKGEHIEVKAVGFTPKPRVVSVELTHGGLDHMRMAGREIRGNRFVIHAKIPFIADLFMDVPDTHIWLTSEAPASFLRWEGPLAEPKDTAIRVDLLGGGKSGPAQPVRKNAKD